VVDRQELKIGLTRLRRGWVEDAEVDGLLQSYSPGLNGFMDLTAFEDFVRP
jgi:hypothetical protein